MDWLTIMFSGVSWLTIMFGGVSIVAIAIAFAVLALLRLRTTHRERWMFERYMFERQRELERYQGQAVKKIKSDIKTLAEVIDEKKKKFENTTGVSFHFVDGDEVKSFYNDTFKEPYIESLVSEMAGELTGEITGGLPKVLESKLGTKDLSKWISTIKLPDTSLPGMFARYQREAIKRGEVTLGLEELDIELNQVEEFKAALEALNKTFGVTLAEGVVESHITRLKQQAAEKMVVKLETVTGWVLIEGKFKIERRDSMYKCTYMHPVNGFISSDSCITISFIIQAGKIEPRYAGNYAESVGREIPMRLFGKVWQPISRKSETMDLEVTPTAVYS